MSEQLVDRELVAASLRGDVRAFGRLVERHHGAVTSVAFAITRDLALAEDVAQDTFVIAWTRLRELRDTERLRPWLCNIARNKSKNELRGRKHESIVDAPDAIDAKPSVIDAALAREAEAQLRRVLDDMPAAYREPLVLFYWQEQSIANVAAALDITEQAAQKRISRARGYVGEELGSRFDEAGRARRPAKVAAAAVVAVLAMHGAPAATAAGMSKAGAIKLSAILATCLALGVGVWHQARTRGAAASPASPIAPTAVERAAPASTHAAPAPSLAAPDRGSAANASDADAPGKGGYPAPGAYEITILTPTSVAVNLAGGTSPMYVWQTPPPPTFDRHVRGRVLDASGKPIAGAAVVVGGELPTRFGALVGDGGAVTGASGAFDVVVHTDTALSAIALHARAGWSAPVAIAAGKGDAEVAIRIAGGGGLSGTVRRGGVPTEAKLIVLGDDKLALELETGADGRFALPLLAPGTYRITAHAGQLFAGGTSPRAEKTVVVDKATNVTVDLPTGVLVVATARDAATLKTIEYFLVPGDGAPTDHDALRVLARGGKALSTLFGGQDVDRPMQFHDVAPGVHTLCVDRRVDRDHPLPLLCKKLTVPADVSVLEVEVGGP